MGAPPAGGWPVVLMFQGSFFSANTFWDGAPSMPFGGWSQAHLTRALLDAGYAVITPKTRGDGGTYWDKFRALAIAAGAFATCAGSLCSVPASLPADHPPTLFMHGEKDTTVPISTMRLYRDALEAQHTPTRVVTDPNAGHAWLDTAPADVLAWFAAH